MQVGAQGSGLGGCRKACKACEMCAEGDEVCYDRNRERGGFMTFDEQELGDFF